MNKKTIILSGPTASGKSALALFIAQKFDAVIINCDSKQLYKEIPIITAQPTADEMAQIPHELYGCISVAEHCSVGRWIDMVKPVIDKTHADGKIPMLVGGTGMYIKYLTEGIPQMPDIDEEIRTQVRAQIQEEGSAVTHTKLAAIDPDIAAKLEPGDSQRIARAMEVIRQTGKSLLYWQQQKAEAIYPADSFIKFFLSPPREKVYENCNSRFVKMLDAGLMDEMKALDAMQLDPELPSMRSHGVPEMLAYLHGNMTLEEAVEQSQQNTRHYIKRQFTWFRNQMKDTVCLDDFDIDAVKTKMLKELKQFLLT